jgi:hypothetical protein
MPTELDSRDSDVITGGMICSAGSVGDAARWGCSSNHRLAGVLVMALWHCLRRSCRHGHWPGHVELSSLKGRWGIASQTAIEFFSGDGAHPHPQCMPVKDARPMRKMHIPLAREPGACQWRGPCHSHCPSPSRWCRCACTTVVVNGVIAKVELTTLAIMGQIFWGSIFTDQDPITRHDPAIRRCRTVLTSRSPKGAVVHGSTEGRGPVPSVHPLCKPLHRPLSHLDLPSAPISALVHRNECFLGSRRFFPESM